MPEQKYQPMTVGQVDRDDMKRLADIARVLATTGPKADDKHPLLGVTRALLEAGGGTLSDLGVLPVHTADDDVTPSKLIELAGELCWLVAALAEVVLDATPGPQAAAAAPPTPIERADALYAEAAAIARENRGPDSTERARALAEVGDRYIRPDYTAAKRANKSVPHFGNGQNPA